MGIEKKNQTEAEQALTSEIERFQQKVASDFRHREKSATIELVRALDLATVSERIAPLDSIEDGIPARGFYARVGAAVALRPFLAVVKHAPGGVPWIPSPRGLAQYWRTYLDCCGRLTHLRRMAALEHYGLSKTTVTDGRVVIETSWGREEVTAMRAMRQTWKRHESSESATDDARWPQLWKRMRKYVERDPKNLIGYDNDEEVVAAYLEKARRYGRGYLEAEALPPHVQIADRTFGEWKLACDQALGRILCHIDFARLLHVKRSNKVALRDVLTLFARREDVAAVWQEAGLKADLVESTMAALTLTIDDMDAWEQAYEMPTPFYIDMGRHFVLLTCFGALTNPYFAMFRYLRRIHKVDWDRGVDQREGVFRSDLMRVFAPPRFLVPAHGFKLRRADGSAITDVDAVIFDRDRGRLALVQLKWHDVFGRSLAERESRRRNILLANSWVERVHDWIGGRSSADVLRALGIQETSSDDPPLLLVLARYVARFSGTSTQDARAIWLGWPEVSQAMREFDGEDPLGHLAKMCSASSGQLIELPDIREEFRFPGLTVDLRVSSMFRVSSMS